jgi:hypothetical protein
MLFWVWFGVAELKPLIILVPCVLSSIVVAWTTLQHLSSSNRSFFFSRFRCLPLTVKWGYLNHKYLTKSHQKSTTCKQVGLLRTRTFSSRIWWIILQSLVMDPTPRTRLGPLLAVSCRKGASEVGQRLLAAANPNTTRYFHLPRGTMSINNIILAEGNLQCSS